MAALEAEAEAIMEMVGRRVQQSERSLESSTTPAVTTPTEPQNSIATASASASATPATVSDTTTPSSAAETPMDVDQPGK